MKRNIWNLTPVVIVLIILVIMQTAYIAVLNWRYAIVAAVVSLGVLIFAFIRLRMLNKDIRKYIFSLADDLRQEGSDVLSGFTMPILVTHDTGEIIWYNESFRTHVLHGRDAYGEHYGFIISKDTEDILRSNRRADVEYDDKSFSVYESDSAKDDRVTKILYFFDETNLKRTAKEYGETRPVVMLITIDNMEDVTKDWKNSERAIVSGEIDNLVESMAQDGNALLTKLASDRYLLVMEERVLNDMEKSKFKILETVKGLTVEGRTGGLSLSIGAGCGSTLKECDLNARQALDMVLGRGGDQAAIKNKNEYKFFGSASKTVERRTKVRARVVASAVKELILSSDNVLIMGHGYADLDALGAAVGLWRAVVELEKTGKIVMTRSKSLALPLLERMEQHGITDAVIEPEQALHMITKRTLLIVVDSHIAELLDSPEVFRKCSTIVVIDHHRRTVDYINNAVIFYHEPYSSSTCELVTEMLQYMGEHFVGSLESEALMSGIMLDTRNFVLRTGVRTFEAAAFLRSRGADPVEVKRLFSGSMDLYMTRSQIVSSAEIIGDCAIATTDAKDGNIRIVAAQAADELLSISGVDASFVIMHINDIVNISARSFGKINVQLIMEKLGGGGHMTMAAAQLKDTTLFEAKRRLIDAINEYNESMA